MSVFIYAPQSGSRIFAANPDNGVVLVTYPNGSAHVFGGELLSVFAATPKRYWRPEAREAAAAIVAAVGGVAFDQQGTISMVVPGVARARAAAIMATIGATHLTAAEEDALLLAGGCTLDEGLKPVRPVCAVHPARMRVAGVQVLSSDEGRATLHITVAPIEGGEPMSYVQSIPLSWSPLTWRHGYQHETLFVLDADRVQWNHDDPEVVRTYQADDTF